MRGVEKGGPRCGLKKTQIYLQKNKTKAQGKNKGRGWAGYQKYLTMKIKQDYETRKQDYGTMTNKTINNKWGAKPDLANRGMKHERKGEDFCKDCDWTWKLNTVGRWLVMTCSCEQKQVTWVRLSDSGKNMTKPENMIKTRKNNKWPEKQES